MSAERATPILELRGIEKRFGAVQALAGVDLEVFLLGREEIDPISRAMDEERIERRALEVLRALDVNIPVVRAPIAALSGGQRQSVAVARAVMGEAKLVMLGEATAALGVAQTKQVLELIARLKQRGLGVLVISHNLADVFQVSDRFVVLRLGQLAGTFDTRAASREQVVGRITGADVAEPRRAG